MFVFLLCLCDVVVLILIILVAFHVVAIDKGLDALFKIWRLLRNMKTLEIEGKIREICEKSHKNSIFSNFFTLTGNESCL